MQESLFNIHVITHVLLQELLAVVRDNLAAVMKVGYHTAYAPTGVL